MRGRQQIFVDEKPNWDDIAQESLILNGEQVLTATIVQGLGLGDGLGD